MPQEAPADAVYPGDLARLLLACYVTRGRDWGGEGALGRWEALRSLGCDWWRDIDSGPVEACVVRFKGRPVLLLPGTNDAFDWAVNFSFFPTRYEGLPGRWHRGFADAAFRVAVLTAAAMHDAAPDRGDHVVAGHSLGGGIAQPLAAIYANTDAAHRTTCVTFGAPPASYGHAKLGYPAIHFRFDRDPIRWVDRLLLGRARLNGEEVVYPGTAHHIRRYADLLARPQDEA